MFLMRTHLFHGCGATLLNADVNNSILLQSLVFLAPLRLISTAQERQDIEEGWIE